MRRLLAWLGAHAAAAMAAGLFLGLALTPLAALLRPLLPLTVGALLVLAASRIPLAGMGEQVARPVRLAAVTALALVLAPVLVWAVARGAALPASLAVSMCLAAAQPVLFSAPAMALLLGLDAALMLGLVVVTAVASPFALALVSGPLLSLHLDLAISPFMLTLRLSAMLLGCLGFGFLVTRLVGAARIARAAPELDGIAVIVLLVFAISVMAGVSDAARHDPLRVAGIIAAAFGLNLGLQLLGVVACLGLGARRALTVGFACGNRNLGLLLAVLPASAPPDVFLFLALGQFPIYLMPWLTAPAYRRLLGGIRRP